MWFNYEQGSDDVETMKHVIQEQVKGTNTTMLPVLLLLMWGGVTIAGSQCERSSAVRFSVSSWRNQTGHRLVAAEMRSDDSLEDAVSLSVDQWTERCGAAGTVALSVTTSSAGSTIEVPTCPVASTPVPPSTTPVTARPDYHHLPGLSYYKLHETLMTWYEGQQSCESEGAHLAVLDSQEEMAAVSNLTTNISWIGVHRHNYSSPWMTVLGQPLKTDFKIWRGNEPSGDVNCGVLIGLNGISNHRCAQRYRVLCELEPQSLPTH